MLNCLIVLNRASTHSSVVIALFVIFETKWEVNVRAFLILSKSQWSFMMPRSKMHVVWFI